MDNFRVPDKYIRNSEEEVHSTCPKKPDRSLRSRRKEVREKGGDLRGNDSPGVEGIVEPQGPTSSVYRPEVP